MVVNDCETLSNGLSTKKSMLLPQFLLLLWSVWPNNSLLSDLSSCDKSEVRSLCSTSGHLYWIVTQPYFSKLIIRMFQNLGVRPRAQFFSPHESQLRQLQMLMAWSHMKCHLCENRIPSGRFDSKLQNSLIIGTAWSKTVGNILGRHEISLLSPPTTSPNSKSTYGDDLLLTSIVCSTCSACFFPLCGNTKAFSRFASSMNSTIASSDCQTGFEFRWKRSSNPFPDSWQQSIEMNCDQEACMWQQSLHSNIPRYDC